MGVLKQEWGSRLSDILRTALTGSGSPDFETARTLALEGDGQARTLAQEFTLMIRGLGITIGVLLSLLEETSVRTAKDDDAASTTELTDLLYQFRNSLKGLLVQPIEPVRPLDEEVLLVERVMAESMEWFSRSQTRLAGEIVEAIEQGDASHALKLLAIKEVDQYVPFHDLLVKFMADSFGWVLRWFGPDELLRFHLATAESQREGFEKWESLPVAEFARMTAFLLKQHMGQVVVREDTEKFTIKQTPCGSGGRLRLNGAYSGPGALPFVETRGPLTFGEPSVPVYCSHCAIWNGAATLRWFGHPQWVFERAAQPNGECTLHIYKNPDDAPKDYAKRIAVPVGEN